jgi:hypothetical protein
MRSIRLSGMYSIDFDPSEWCLPPLEVDDAAEPPPERDRPYGGVYLGSQLGSVPVTRDAGFVDLGAAVVGGFVAVRPGLVELARLGSTDFGSLTATERVDALIVLEQQRAWLDGVQQQLLAEVARGDTSRERWAREEVAAALGLAPVTAGSRLKNAEQLVTRLPPPWMRCWPVGSKACRPPRSPKPPTSSPISCCPRSRTGC